MCLAILKEIPIHKYLVKNIRLYLIVTAIYIPISVYSGNIPHSIMELMKQLLFDGTFIIYGISPLRLLGVFSLPV